MLRISKLADYATAMMAYAARVPGNNFTSKVIAHDIKLNPPTINKILKLLAKAHLLISERGAQGGYQLSRPATEISMADIISAIDGKIALTECSHLSSHCDLQSHCQTKHSWQLINQVIFDTLSEINLAHIADAQFQPKKLFLNKISK